MNRSSFFLFFLYCYSKELWDFITFLFSLKMVRCALCAKKKRKEALKHFLVPSIPHSKEDPWIQWRFWPDPWPLPAPSQNSWSFGFSIRFGNIASVTGKTLWSTDCQPLYLCGGYEICMHQWSWASSGRDKIQSTGGAGHFKLYLRLCINTLSAAYT